MVYLVGVDHLVQHRNLNYDDQQKKMVNAFASYLEQEVVKYRIVLLAEEFSAEALRDTDEPDSTAQTVAEKLGIAHRFCDPNTLERVEHGIRKDKDRENFWIKRIRANEEDAILFICGENHLNSFSAELMEAGFQAEIISQGWGNAI